MHSSQISRKNKPEKRHFTYPHSSASSSRITSGFTIVELLVVIVVIGILATITIIAYTGISQKAIDSSIKSDLVSTQKKFAIYQVENSRFPIPSDIESGCSTPSSPSKVCIKPSGSNQFTLAEVENFTGSQTFCIEFSNGSNMRSYITNDSTPGDGYCPNWVAVGNQVWAKYNRNVGTMVSGATSQTNNSVLEKYCYNNTESNCTTYGGLYQWNEAMQYVTTAGAQGICPAGTHIPTDNDWKILEVQLGMTQAQADATGYRGTDQGAKLKAGGLSGLALPIAGNRGTSGFFNLILSNAYLWSSSESGVNVLYRGLDSGVATVYRDTNDKGVGLSVRCLRN